LEEGVFRNMDVVKVRVRRVRKKELVGEERMGGGEVRSVKRRRGELIDDAELRGGGWRESFAFVLG